MKWLIEYAGEITVCLRVVICIISFLVLAEYSRGALHDRYELIKQSLSSGLMSRLRKNTKKSMFAYDYCRDQLDSFGVTYYSNGSITPMTYVVYKIGCVVGGLLISMAVGTPALIIMLAAYFMPDLICKKRNARDNREMLASLMDVYDVILLQVNSCEYITRILVDAYMVAKHPRLKAALVELTGDIISTNDLKTSIGIFGRKFKNDNINNLVMLVTQLADTGITAAMMNDIKNYLAVLQDSYNKSRQDKVERVCQMCAIAVFVCIMGFILMACFIDIFETFKSITG